MIFSVFFTQKRKLGLRQVVNSLTGWDTSPGRARGGVDKACSLVLPHAPLPLQGAQDALPHNPLPFSPPCVQDAPTLALGLEADQLLPFSPQSPPPLADGAMQGGEPAGVCPLRAGCLWGGRCQPLPSEPDEEARRPWTGQKVSWSSM